MDRLVIVGASLAGVHAAESLREFGFDREILLVGAEPTLPYDRPPLSKEALALGPRPPELLIRNEDWFEDNAINVSLGTAAVGLDIGAQTLSTTRGPIAYDGLVIATGSTPRTQGLNASGVHVLRTLDDAAELHASMKLHRKLTVIGAGFIGLEVASTATEMGLDVTVIELAPEPLNRILGDELGEWFRLQFQARGVRFVCGAVVSSITHEDQGVRIVGNFGEVIADLAVLGIGAEPAIGWLQGSGIALADGVVCDETLATNVSNVVAAGDVVRWYNPLFDESMRIEQWTNAVEQGRHSARTLLGDRLAYTPVPYLWSDLFDIHMRFVGRSNGADHVEVNQRGDNSFVGIFGRHGIQIGAVCINATRELAQHREAIASRQDMAAVVGN